MTKIFKRSAAFMAMFIAIIMCLAVLAPLVACANKVSVTALDKTTATVEAGSTVTLKVTTSRDLEEGEVILWTSDKEDVATVDQKGKVKGVAGGTAIITASINDTSASCEVTVTDKAEISLNLSSLTIDYAANKTATLTASCKLNGAVKEDATVTWETSDDKVATVANGVVTAKAVGTATITAKYQGAEATCEVKVTQFVEVAQEFNALDAASWYKFGSKGNTSDGVWPNQVQNGKVVITGETPARMNLFRVKIDPNDDTSAFINPMDNVNNFDKEGGQKFYGYEYLFNVDLSADGNFDLIVGGTATLPAIYNGTMYRGIYLSFSDGKVELRQSGNGGDSVQATAAYEGKVTDIKSVTFSITRINDTTFLLKVYVNGQKLELTGTPTVGELQNGDYLENRSVNQNNGYGPRFGVVPAESSTVTISGITVKRSANA